MRGDGLPVKLVMEPMIVRFFAELALGRVSSIKVLDSEKQRSFLVGCGRKRYVLKLCLPFLDEEYMPRKMNNERIVLGMLSRRGLSVAPRAEAFIPQGSGARPMALVQSWVPDCQRAMSVKEAKSLARVLGKVHSIQADSFTPVFGDINDKHDGTALEMVLLYIRAIETDIRGVKRSVLERTLGCAGRLEGLLQEVLLVIKRNRALYQSVRTFSLLHCHVVRNKERRHVLIGPGGAVHLVDWESVCFGERELEAASFLYENDTLPQKVKTAVIRGMEAEGPLSKLKIKIYMALLSIDDAVEDIKKVRLMARNSTLVADKNGFLRTYRFKAGFADNLIKNIRDSKDGEIK